MGVVVAANDAYEATRAAVGAWATSGTRSSGTRPTGDAVYLASDPGVGVYMATLGALVATYPAVGYARWLDYVTTKCTTIGVVEIYVGAIDELGRLSSYGDGSLSEFDPNRPRYIPGGAPVFIVWYVPDSSHSASAKAGLREVT